MRHIDTLRNVESDFGRRNSVNGFTLIELLVAVVIGLLGVLVIFQVVSTWDAQRRTTVGGNDAQIAATLSGFNLERDIRKSGWGIGLADVTARAQGTPLVMGCPVVAQNATGNFTFLLTPVSITQGAGGQPDSVTVLSGSSQFIADEKRYLNGSATSKTSQLISASGVFRGDLLVFMNDNPANRVCQLVEVTGTPDPVTFEHLPNASYTPQNATVPRTASFNPTATDVRLTGGVFFSLGPSPTLKTWSIRDQRTLSWRDAFGATPAVPNDVAEGIIDMQAQYGYDTNGDGRIDGTEWRDTLPASPEWGRVLAIQVALLSRSQQYEPQVVTTNAPTYFGSPGIPFVMRNVDGTTDSFTAASTDPNNWRQYRYRVYEKVIPVRNLLWGNSP
jgi:type IV pilus assembly protein PilW